MPITVPAASAGHYARTATLKLIAESAETVDSYCVDYLTSEGTIDHEYLELERVSNLRRVLDELDAIVVRRWEWPLMEAATPAPRVLVDTVDRARALADAIREALGKTPAPSAQGCVSADHDGALVPATRVIDGRPYCDWCAEGLEPAKPIPHTGQRARIRSLIVAGQPWVEGEVWVIEIDGDRLTYTTDANPSWFSVVTRSEIADWSIVEGEVVA